MLADYLLSARIQFTIYLKGVGMKVSNNYNMTGLSCSKNNHNKSFGNLIIRYSDDAFKLCEKYTKNLGYIMATDENWKVNATKDMYVNVEKSGNNLIKMFFRTNGMKPEQAVVLEGSPSIVEVPNVKIPKGVNYPKVGFYGTLAAMAKTLSVLA